MANKIQLPEQQYLPPEFELDEYHPENQEYLHSLHRIQRTIVAHTVTMMPWHVQAVKDRLKGMSNVDIATANKVTPNQVSNVLTDVPAKKLRAMLQHYQTALDGPGDAQRSRMLWEIALDNQQMEPRVSISAISEMNKMDGTYEVKKSSGDINITINNNQFPRGKLDE